jgi:hypothetical protein
LHLPAADTPTCKIMDIAELGAFRFLRSQCRFRAFGAFSVAMTGRDLLAIRFKPSPVHLGR